jgi:hypothetical protein
MTTEKVRILYAKNASSSGSAAIHFIIIVMNKNIHPFLGQSSIRIETRSVISASRCNAYRLLLLLLLLPVEFLSEGGV